jgi:hypothetical protein
MSSDGSKSNENAVAQDFLCHNKEDTTCSVCEYCKLIALTLEDERKKYETYSNAHKVGYQQGYFAGLHDASEAVKATCKMLPNHLGATCYKEVVAIMALSETKNSNND